MHGQTQIDRQTDRQGFIIDRQTMIHYLIPMNNFPDSGRIDVWLGERHITLADITLTLLLFRLSCLGFSMETFQDGDLPLVDTYYDFAKLHLPGFTRVCLNFQGQGGSLSTQKIFKQKKSCNIL